MICKYVLFNLHQNEGSWEGLMSVVWMFLQYAPWKSHRGFNTLAFMNVATADSNPSLLDWRWCDGCYHLQSRYLYQFTWIHRIALNLLGKRDRQLNTMASLWHHYGTWNWSSWYFLPLQTDFCPLENCGSLSFPSLISLLLFVAFRVPSAMWGICGRQWASTSTFEIEGVRVLTSIPFVWRMLKVTSSNSPRYPATIDGFQFRTWL